MADFKVEFASNDTNFDANFGEVQEVNPGATPDPGTAEQIKQAVADYLNENPVQAGATAEQAAQIAQNKAEIERLSDDKLDASELPNAINEALEHTDKLFHVIHMESCCRLVKNVDSLACGTL